MDNQITNRRQRFNAETLQFIKKNIGEMIEIIDSVQSGEATISRAAYNHGIDNLALRKVLYNLESLHEPSITDGRATANEIATPEEQFYADLNGISPSNTEALYSVMPHDYLETMKFMFNPENGHLTERESRAMKLRYFDGLSLNDVGKEFCVTTERIRQIIAKSVRKMRHPSRFKYFKYGMEYYEQAKALVDEEKSLLIEQIKQELVSTDSELSNLRGQAANVQYLESSPLDKDLRDLNLSVRSYNVLLRSGVRDLRSICNMSYQQLCRCRNMGRKSAQEVVDMVNGFGLTNCTLITSMKER